MRISDWSSDVCSSDLAARDRSGRRRERRRPCSRNRVGLRRKSRAKGRSEMRDIVANGLNSIRVGLEDFEQAAHDPARLTSAVRNIYAGILILAKGKLTEIYPPGSQGVQNRAVHPQLLTQRL